MRAEPAVTSRRRPLQPARPRNARTIAGSLVKHAVLIAICTVMIYPLLWMVASSLRPSQDVFNESGLLVRDLRPQNYVDGWTALDFSFGHFLVNSTIVTVLSVIGNVLSCSLAAYAFARMEFRGRKLFFGIMLVSIMLPIHVIIVPQYVLFSTLGLVNAIAPLVLPNFLATNAFFIFLMVQFIRGIPTELDEAALIDGAGHWRIFVQVMVPLMRPAIATTAIFSFIWSWNDFFTPLIFLTSQRAQTVPVALRTFVDSTGGTNWGPLFAMSVVSLIPVFAVFLIGQRWLVQGIATTGLK